MKPFAFYHKFATGCTRFYSSVCVDRNLKNKLVVVTGGAEGLGLEIARSCLKKGAKATILLDINEKKGRKAEKKLGSKFGHDKAVFCKCDVTTDLDCTYKSILQAYEKVDLLVNNAGILNDKQVERTITTNILALVQWSLKFWQHMRKDKGGCGGTIMNLSSIYGYRIGPHLPVYQATKVAIYGFTKALGHKENFCKSGVRVVAVCPGFTTTAMTEAPIAWSYQKDLEAFVKTQDWQKKEAVGRAAVKVYERAPSGTCWLIEGSRPIKKV